MKRVALFALSLTLFVGSSLPAATQPPSSRERDGGRYIRPDDPPAFRRDVPRDDYRYDDTRWQRSWSTREESPSWFPDGRMIAFASNREGSHLDIYTLDTTDPRCKPQRLTFSRSNDYAPSVSPDGRWIAFVSERDGRPAVFVMRSDGREQRLLARPNGSGLATPTWSPDGRSVAFASKQDGGSMLFRVSLSSGRIERLGNYASR